MLVFNPPERDFADQVRYWIDRLILETTKEKTTESFADLIGVDPCTVSAWRKKGDIPPFQAERLEKLFGPDLAPAKQLSKKLADLAAASNA